MDKVEKMLFISAGVLIAFVAGGLIYSIISSSRGNLEYQLGKR